MLKMIIKLMTVIVAFSFMAGCGKNTPEPTATHHESGSYTLILSEIYDECMSRLKPMGLFPLAKANYSFKYIVFRLLANNRTGMKILRLIVPRKKPAKR